MTMHAVPVRPDAPDDLARFVEVPFRVYAGDPRWVPPFRAEVRRLLSPGNPFYAYGSAQAFVACDGDAARASGGEAVGRIAAMVSSRLQEEGKPIGLVGFFECEDRPEAAAALFEAAFAWLRERGCARVWGPMSFSIYHSYRLMTDGFDREPFYGEPYNPPYYPKLFEAAGFRPHARWFSWDLDEAMIRGIQAAAEARTREVGFEPGGLKIVPLDLARFDAELERLHVILSKTFEANLGYTPIAFEEFRDLYGSTRSFLIPELVPFLVDERGETLGFCYVFPDIAPAVRRMRGDSGLMAKLRFAFARRRIDRLNLHTMGILPTLRKKGIVEWGFSQVLKVALDRGFRKAIGCLIREGPTVYQKTGPPSRAYSLYEREL